MSQAKEVAKVQQKIVAILARMLVVAPESIKTDARYQELFNSEPDAVRAFAVQVENALNVMIGDSVLSAHPTIADLVAYCAAHQAGVRGGRLYVVVCRMPDGSTRERIYAARGHEKAVEQAMADGAEAVLSVEREDAEDSAPTKSSALGKVVIPLFLGLLVGGAVFVLFWWKSGFERFW